MIEFDKNEHVIFEVRKHWFPFVIRASILMLVGIVPLFAIVFFKAAPFEIIFAGGSILPLVTFFYAFLVLILWLVGFIFWTNHYLDIWVITNQKLIDIEQYSLFKREISILHLDKIQDITSEIDGLVPTLMKYGDLHVQTAGQQREFVIRGIANPNKVREKLDEALDRFKKANPHLNKGDF